MELAPLAPVGRNPLLLLLAPGEFLAVLSIPYLATPTAMDRHIIYLYRRSSQTKLTLGPALIRNDFVFTSTATLLPSKVAF